MNGLSRRTLLRMTAGAAGAAALSPLISAEATATPVGSVVPMAGTPEILTDDLYPVGFFWPPPARQITDARYAEIAEAGFNLVLGGNDVVNRTANRAMLPVAERAGLRALVVEDRINRAVPKPGFENDLRAVVEEYQAFPAFKGFRIDDEPDQRDYPRYRMITDVLAEAAPDKLSHFNLVPVYESHLDQQYQELLRRFVAQIDPTFVSFDHYPLYKNNTIRATFFLNHRRIREAGLAAGLPTWVYIQSVDHWDLKRPNRAELAWQISIGLVYGCKGLQYFTYWTPEDAADFVFGEALIKKDGCQSQVYVDAKVLNNGYLQPVGRQLKHLVSESVSFSSGSAALPLGGDAFAAAQSSVLDGVTGSQVILGEFRQQPVGTQRWLLVANRSYTATANTTLTVKSGVTSVSAFDPASGQYGSVPLNGRQFAVNLAPGMGKLYRLALA